MLLGAFHPQTTTEDNKVTNSERSASQIYRVTRRSVAQDDGFVGGMKYNWLAMQKPPQDRKNHRLSG
jgi:hypothetical protein